MFFLHLHVIHELGSNHDTGDDQPMNIEGIDGQRWLPLREPIEIDIGDNIAGGAAIGILEDPLQVALDGDGGSGQTMED